MNSPRQKSLVVDIQRDRYKTPKWNLTLVLASLLGKPYEPLEEADLKLLTHKYVFLLMVASMKCGHE